MAGHFGIDDFTKKKKREKEKRVRKKRQKEGGEEGIEKSGSDLSPITQ